MKGGESNPRIAAIDESDLVKNEGSASKIDYNGLVQFLKTFSTTFVRPQEAQLKRFAYFFGDAFSGTAVSESMREIMFGKSTVDEIADVPVCYIAKDVYDTSFDWISQLHPNWGFEDYIAWSLDHILSYMETQQLVKFAQQPMTSESQSDEPRSNFNSKVLSSGTMAGIFLVLAMALRSKPFVIITIVPKLRENSMFKRAEKLRIVIWMVVQVCHGDLSAGLSLWSDNLLPLLDSRKLGSSSELRDLVLQLVEKILATPRARDILVTNPLWRQAKIVPPESLDLLLHCTFHAAFTRVEESERFRRIYPTLKDVALAGDRECGMMNQATQEIEIIAIKAIAEGIPALCDEATSIFLWTLTQNYECYLLWEKIYPIHTKASVAVLRRLRDEWKEHAKKLYSVEVLATTLRRFRKQNKIAVGRGDALFRDADKYCKAILAKVWRDNCCKAIMLVVLAVLFVGSFTFFFGK